jgi:serine/threonine protein kinase
MAHHDSDWTKDVKVESFMSILRTLDSMHQRDLVHGDIRLANLLISGFIVDFDFVGLLHYPKRLNNLTKDGERHPKVVDAIKADDVHEMRLEIEHDCFFDGKSFGVVYPTTETKKAIGGKKQVRPSKLANFQKQ